MSKSIAYFLILTLFLSGCASYRPIGVRHIESTPVKIGVIEERFIKNFPLALINVPDENNNKLTVSLKKQINQKVEYQTQISDETVYQRNVGPIENGIDTVVRGFKKNPIVGILELILAPLKILIDFHPASYNIHKETKYEKIPNSERYLSSYKENLRTLPVVNAVIFLEGLGSEKTDTNGEATFYGNPSLFDNGVKLHIIENNEFFLIKREKVIKKYKADWYPGAKLISDLSTIGGIAHRVRKTVILGGGPYAIGGAILVEVATGLIIGFVVEIAATKFEENYQWSVLRVFK